MPWRDSVHFYIIPIDDERPGLGAGITARLQGHGDGMGEAICCNSPNICSRFCGVFHYGFPMGSWAIVLCPRVKVERLHPARRKVGCLAGPLGGCKLWYNTSQVALKEKRGATPVALRFKGICP